MRYTHTHAVRRATSAAGTVALMAALAACGSSSENASSSAAVTNGGSQRLAAEVQKLAVRPSSIGITTPIQGGVPKGKHLVLLQCAFPDCASLGTAVQAAAAKVGWTVTKIGIGTSPEKTDGAS